MRKIEFRGKRIDGEGLVYGYVDATMYKDIVVIHTETGTFGVDPETVCQFTGLHDKNGKEIYEGDLLKVWCLPFADAEEEIAKVNWDEKRAGFILLYNNGSYHYFYDVMESEVIGNIHDNKEQTQTIIQ